MAYYTRGSLKLDKSDATYCPGEVCSGTAIITTREAHSVLGISLHFLGEVTATIPTFNGVTQGETFEVMNYYEILSNSGDRDAKGNRQLTEGENRFPFQSKLPENLPANFNLESIGSIKYSLKLEIYIDENFSSAQTLELQILNSLDLNGIQGLKESHWSVSYWKAGCLCREKMELDVSTGKTGFAIGEHLNCKTKVRKKSNKKLTLRCALIQVVTPRIDGITMEGRREMGSTIKVLCRKGNSEFDNLGLDVPDVHASYISGLLDITYELAAIMEDTKGNTLLTAKVPIVIGNTSLRA